jgi:hypothetical protein
MWNTYAMKIDWHAITQKREWVELSWELHMHNKINISWTFFALLHSFTHSFSRSLTHSHIIFFFVHSKLSNAMCREWSGSMCERFSTLKIYTNIMCAISAFSQLSSTLFFFLPRLLAVYVAKLSGRRVKIMCAESTLTITHIWYAWYEPSGSEEIFTALLKCANMIFLKFLIFQLIGWLGNEKHFNLLWVSFFVRQKGFYKLHISHSSFICR